MKVERLNSLIQKEEENLRILTKKKASIEKKIETSNANLDRYKVLKNNECYKEILSAANQHGISLDTVIQALNSGDLLSLQKMLEQNQESANNDQEEDPEVKNLGGIYSENMQ